MPLAWDRERHNDIVGMRTFPFVAVGACAYMLLGFSLIGADAPDTKARVLQGLLTGIGFVGGGAILKHDDSVSGTASAASIWIMGAIGTATAMWAWGYAIAFTAVPMPNPFYVVSRDICYAGDPATTCSWSSTTPPRDMRPGTPWTLCC